jgi:hypothetical protein
MELIGWWLLSVAVWLCALTTVSPAEVAVAAVLAAPIAWVARQARRQVAREWRFRARWFAPGWRLPAAVVAETAQVWRAAVRSGRDETTRTVDLGPEESRRAVGVVLLSTSPGLVVLDTGDDEVRVHAFRDHPDALEKAVGS